MPRTHRVNELRSLELHRLIAAALDDDVVDEARARMCRWREAGTMHPEYARRWLKLLDRPVPEIAEAIVRDDQWMRDMRQTTPFTGVVSDPERWRIIRTIR